MLDFATRLEMLRDPKGTYSSKDLGRALNRAAKNIDAICAKLPLQTDDQSLTYEARFVQLTVSVFSHMVTEGLPAKKALGRRAQPHTIEEMFWLQYDHLHNLLDEAIEGEVENRAVQVAENLIADARREFEREQKLLDDQYQSLQEAHQSLQARYEAALLEIETLEQYKTELDTLTQPQEVVMPKKPAQKDERIRINQAAKMLGITSKQFISTLHEIEHTQYTHHANVLDNPEIIDHVAEVLGLKVQAAA